jgi:MerR family transcriptional regulator/heat shock protein HspR
MSQEDNVEEETTTAAVYVMSVAAELVGTHPQTLRDYERRGLISPSRTGGGNRRYTHNDIQKVLRIKKLRDEGMSLTAISQLMEYEEALLILKQENECLRDELEHTQSRLGDVETRLHEVESTLHSGGLALVKAERKDVVKFPGVRPSVTEGRTPDSDNGNKEKS